MTGSGIGCQCCCCRCGKELQTYSGISGFCHMVSWFNRRSPTFILYYCLITIGVSLGFGWYFDCSRILEETDYWDRCSVIGLESILQFTLVLATVILGALLGVGFAIKYRGEKTS